MNSREEADKGFYWGFYYAREAEATLIGTYKEGGTWQGEAGGGARSCFSTPFPSS